MSFSDDVGATQPIRAGHRSRRQFLQAGAAVCGLGSLRSAGAATPDVTRRIKHVRLHPVTMSRIYKTHVAPAGGHAEGKEGSRYLLLELVTEDGTSGWGELSDIETIWNIPRDSVLQRFLERRLKDRDIQLRQKMSAEMSRELPTDWHRELRRMLATTVDMALLDLAGRIYQVPAYELLGGLYRDRLPISWVAFIRDTASLEKEIKQKAAEGFRAYKLKVGLDFKADVEHVKTLRAVAGPQVYLKVDASGSWEEKEAIEKIHTLAKLGVDAVETPIRTASRDIAKNRPELVNDNVHEVAASLARVRRAVPAEIIEHVVDFSDEFSLALARAHAVDVFNVAVSQAGSVRRTERLIQIAEAADIKVLLGSTVELGVGTACALHVGCAARGVSVSSDLVGPGLLVDDVIQPRFQYRNGDLPILHTPGLGVTPAADKLAKYRTKAER